MTHSGNNSCAAGAGRQANRAAALAWQAAGFTVFPADPATGAPRVPWRDRAEITRARVEAWWAGFPLAMAGLPRGDANRLSVIDFDVAGGEDPEAANARLAALAAAIGDAGGTRDGAAYVCTPKGGLHIRFRHVEGVTNARGDLLPQRVDVRGHGGYVIAPGAVNEDGGSCRWIEGGDGWARLAEVRAMRCAASSARSGRERSRRRGPGRRRTTPGRRPGASGHP